MKVFLRGLFARKAACAGVLAAAIGTGFCSKASGAMLMLTGDGPLGDLTGNLDYVFNSTTGFGDLTINLTNTSRPSNGGFLTGFVFNVNGNATATLLNNPTSLFYDVNGPEDASPYDAFEAGAALASKKSTDGNFLSAGTPWRGLGVGQSGTFMFSVSGPDAAILDSWSFMSERSYGPDDDSAVFLARFMGFDDGGSNKTPVGLIPLPSAAWGGLALLAALGAARIRKRAASGQ